MRISFWMSQFYLPPIWNYSWRYFQWQECLLHLSLDCKKDLVSAATKSILTTFTTPSNYLSQHSCHLSATHCTTAIRLICAKGSYPYATHTLRRTDYEQMFPPSTIWARLQLNTRRYMRGWRDSFTTASTINGDEGMLHSWRPFRDIYIYEYYTT
jgi:hypothetical protein